MSRLLKSECKGTTKIYGNKETKRNQKVASQYPLVPIDLQVVRKRQK